ncbi:MAG: circularly permuted type 2 ATP-grasp protein, partial [Rhodospirillales bacterium]|nr:circularly permuted type 2 ATP-grasp protein [Rhodospirillales bacterium]
MLFRRQEGPLLDPLELSPGGGGTPGLLDAIRNGNVRVVNDVGTALAEAPGLAAFLPQLCRRLLGEDLMLPSQATLWLGEEAMVRTVLRDLSGWLIRPATDGSAAPVLPALLSAEQRATLAATIAAHPERWAASEAPTPSVAPCVGSAGLEPKPIALRLFLAFDGSTWHAMPGGLARALSDEDALAGRLPRNALSKDVWVMADEGSAVQGALGLLTPSLAIRRTAGDLPSRVADHLYWLGRYVERLESAARLTRAALTRLTRGAPLPRELAEIRTLAACLADAGVITREVANAPPGTAALPEALLRSVTDSGPVGGLFTLVARLADAVRDRLTGDMYAHLTQTLRSARSDAQRVGRSLDALVHACVG